MVIIRMKRDALKDKNFDRVLIRISYESLTRDENFDLSHQKTLELQLFVSHMSDDNVSNKSLCLSVPGLNILCFSVELI